MSRPRIKARVYSDRSYVGTLSFGLNTQKIAAKAIDGKDPPPGLYGYVTRFNLSTAEREIFTAYGPWLIFFKELHGSRTVCVHGGDLDTGGKLMATEHDCIRIDNDGLEQLSIFVLKDPILKIEESEIGWFKSWSAEKLSIRYPILRSADFASTARAKNAVRRATAKPIDDGNFDDHTLFWLLAMSSGRSHHDEVMEATPPPITGHGGKSGGAGATGIWDQPETAPAASASSPAGRTAAAATAGVVAAAALSGTAAEDDQKQSEPADDKAADAAADAADDAADNASGNDTATTETSPDVGGGGGGDP